MDKKSDKNKAKKKIIDLRRFMENEMMNTDINGSYTGVTDDMLYDADMEEPLPKELRDAISPVQDADDL